MLYFTRHGNTNYNQLQLCNDDPGKEVFLTPTGIQQAQQLAEKLRHVRLEKILVSELPRTRQTAEIVNRYHQVPIITEAQLNDIRSGFDSLPVSQYQQAIAADRMHLKFNGGESLLEHKQRICHFLEQLLKQQPASVLVVAHEETLRVIKSWFENIPDQEMIELHFANCELLEYPLP